MANSYEELKLFDEEGALGRAMGDREFLTEVIEVYAEDWEEYCRMLRAALAEGSRDRLQTTAHAIKSASMNVGAARAFKIAYDLELNATSAALESEIAPLVDYLEESVSGFLELAKG